MKTPIVAVIAVDKVALKILKKALKVAISSTRKKRRIKEYGRMANDVQNALNELFMADENKKNDELDGKEIE